MGSWGEIILQGLSSLRLQANGTVTKFMQCQKLNSSNATRQEGPSVLSLHKCIIRRGYKDQHSPRCRIRDRHCYIFLLRESEGSDGKKRDTIMNGPIQIPLYEPVLHRRYYRANTSPLLQGRYIAAISGHTLPLLNGRYIAAISGQTRYFCTTK